MRTHIIFAVLLALAAMMPLAACDNPQDNYEKGIAAFIADNDPEAFRWYHKAAEGGHAEAGYVLGAMYEEGKGVAQDYVKARYWYRKAAEAGIVGAQLSLGVMYDKGHGITQNYAEAHKWYNIAVASGYKRAGKTRDAIAKKMTTAQITEAQKRASEWLKAHPAARK